MSTMQSTTRVGLALSAAVFALSVPVILQNLDPPQKPVKVDRLDRLSLAIPSPFVFHETVDAICKEESECHEAARSPAQMYSLAKLALTDARRAQTEKPDTADFDYETARTVVNYAGRQWGDFVKQYAK